MSSTPSLFRRPSRSRRRSYVARTRRRAERQRYWRLIEPAASLAIVELALAEQRPVIVLARDPQHADQLDAEIRWFSDNTLPVAHFVEWETLPYDAFSPHQDIVFPTP